MDGPSPTPPTARPARPSSAAARRWRALRCGRRRLRRQRCQCRPPPPLTLTLSACRKLLRRGHPAELPGPWPPLAQRTRLPPVGGRGPKVGMVGKRRLATPPSTPPTTRPARGHSRQPRQGSAGGCARDGGGGGSDSKSAVAADGGEGGSDEGVARLRHDADANRTTIGVAAGAPDECQSSARGARAATTAMSPAADAAGVSVDSAALPL